MFLFHLAVRALADPVPIGIKHDKEALGLFFKPLLVLDSEQALDCDADEAKPAQKLDDVKLLLEPISGLGEDSVSAGLDQAATDHLDASLRERSLE